jgi:hypothetical protein
MRYQPRSGSDTQGRVTLRLGLRQNALCACAALLAGCSGAEADPSGGQGGTTSSAAGFAGTSMTSAAGSGGAATSVGGNLATGGSPMSSGGVGAQAPNPASGAPSVSGAGGSNSAGSVSAVGGSPAAGAGNGGSISSSGANAGKAGGGSSAAAGGGADHSDHCVSGYGPDPGDATMKDGPVEYTKSDQIDLIVQPEVMAFMTARKWQAAHFEWHSIRRCNGGFSQSRIDICKFTDMIPSDQECASDGDGYQFFVVHRHMIQALKQRFPSHIEQFTGFPRFPQSAEDLPPQWRDAMPFNAQTIANGKIADEIEKPENLSRFSSEGAFGRWIQCFAPQSSGLHADLHFKWVRSRNTEHGLGNQETNLDNYLFWKMHGWIDDVWEKYRKAKGLGADDPKLKQDLITQCREMDAIAAIIDPNLKPDPVEEPVGPESGVFHEMVRPILENDIARCSGCHGPQGAEAGLTLGGLGVSSAKIVEALVNKPATHGGQYKLVVPGQPEQSWLYLKASGKAAAAGCSATASSSCNAQVMPPSGSGEVTLTSSELETLRRWIADGAPVPTSP